ASRLPAVPYGPSARAANASTPAGSVDAPDSSAGTAHGRQYAATTPPAPARPRQERPGRVAATASTAGAETSIAWKPPAAAGSRASASRPGPPRAAARTAHGSPA